MKIVVLSDTHMPKRAKQLPDTVINGIKDADMIIHAGDWTSLEVYEELKRIAPVIGVYGNVDPPEVREFFEDREIVEVGKIKIGLTHGHLGKKKKTPERALEAFQHEKMDIITFGHSHIPYLQTHGETILFNPGSPTDKRFQPKFSYGIININEGKPIEGKHVFFPN
jgi:uncharacterized protein